MDFFDEFGKKLGETVEKVGKKTENVVETQRIKSQMNSMERNILKNYEELGMKIYKKYQLTGEAEEEFLPVCEEIQRREVLLEQYKEELAEMKGMKRCSNCGAVLERDSTFCKKCGVQVQE